MPPCGPPPCRHGCGHALPGFVFVRSALLAGVRVSGQWFGGTRVVGNLAAGEPCHRFPGQATTTAGLGQGDLGPPCVFRLGRVGGELGQEWAGRERKVVGRGKKNAFLFLKLIKMLILAKFVTK